LYPDKHGFARGAILSVLGWIMRSSSTPAHSFFGNSMPPLCTARSCNLSVCSPSPVLNRTITNKTCRSCLKKQLPMTACRCCFATEHKSPRTNSTTDCIVAANLPRVRER